MELYLLISLVTFLAGFTQGLSGFGSLLLALPLLTFFMDIKTVIPLLALHALAITAILLIQLREHLDWGKINPLLLGSVPGVFLGVFFLKTLDTRIIQAVLGMILVAYPLISVKQEIFKTMKAEWAYLFGFFAGCLGGTLSASGPPVIIYTAMQPWGKDLIKATLQGFFAVSGVLVVVVQGANGLMTPSVLKLFLISLPSLFIGTYAGSFFYGKISDRTYRKIMLILLGLLGVFTLYGTLSQG
jgi:uncharacterized membrane protein YfcA